MNTKLCLAALAGLCGSATAAITTDFATFTDVNIGDPSFAIFLDKFDPALGTLDRVTLTLDAATTSNAMSFDNETGEGGNVTLSIGAEVTATSGYLAALIATPVQTGGGTVTADNDVAADFIGTDAYSISGGSGNDSDFEESTAAGVLNDFTATVGGETFGVAIDNTVFTSSATTGIAGPTDPDPGLFSGTVTVTYEYTPVPEPSALALLGLVGCGALVRRRRA